MDNLELWNKVRTPPASALKQIKGGRLQGFTDVNPQWRYKAMTENFGVCGIGWKYEVVRVWQEVAPEGQLFAFSEIRLYVAVGDKWSEPIPGIGGSMLIAKEQSGLHANDEGYKMAITDALSVAMKMLGVGADIYAGLWDGTKYAGQPQVAEKAEGGTHYCSEHKVVFFKKGKMKGYAHPIGGDTEQWCNEVTELGEATSAPSSEQKHEPVTRGTLLTAAHKSLTERGHKTPSQQAAWLQGKGFSENSLQKLSDIELAEITTLLAQDEQVKEMF